MSEQFWKLIDNLESIARRKRGNGTVSKSNMDTLHSAISTEFGALAGRAFVQISAHLLRNDLKTIVQAVRDLDDNNWIVTPSILTKSDKIASEPTRFQRSWGITPPKVQAPRYNPTLAIYKLPEGMKDFLSAHFNELNDKQQEILVKLQPTPLAPSSTASHSVGPK